MWRRHYIIHHFKMILILLAAAAEFETEEQIQDEPTGKLPARNVDLYGM